MYDQNRDNHDIYFQEVSKQLNSNISFIPKEEMIPSLQTLAATAVFENKLDVDKMPKTIKNFVKQINEQFEEILDEDERVGRKANKNMVRIQC